MVFISEMVNKSINENEGATVRSLQWNVTTNVTLISIKLNFIIIIKKAQPRFSII